MTRSQRLWHRRAWLGLALIFPILLAVALVIRVQHAHVLLSSAVRARGHAQ